MSDALDRLTTSLRHSPILRLAVLGILTLVLLIPISMISSLVAERQQRRDAAVAEVSSKWGSAQSITGPALVLPYTHRYRVTTDDGKQIERTEPKTAIVLAEQLNIRGTMRTETRQRGIFSVPVYKLTLDVRGEFAHPPLADLAIAPTDVDWARAYVAVGVSDPRAIQDAAVLTWNGKPVAFVPGAGAFREAGSGIHAPVAVDDAMQRVAFSFPLVLDGTTSADVVPFARTTTVALQGDYPHPSFQGKWLPTTRAVTDQAFNAQWSVPYLGRDYPQAWTSSADSSLANAIDGSRFGVELVNPVDHYHMAERSVKYAFLFILLTFATVWLIEVLAGVRVHPIQYLMVGAALCLFFLLELALSEHLGFPVAYGLASAAVVAMVGAYSRAVLRATKRASIVAAGVAALYAYLYLLLMNEDYALLIGSIGLFAILGGIMYATRRVDWYSPRSGTVAGGTAVAARE